MAIEEMVGAKVMNTCPRRWASLGGWWASKARPDYHLDCIRFYPGFRMKNVTAVSGGVWWADHNEMCFYSHDAFYREFIKTGGPPAERWE